MSMEEGGSPDVSREMSRDEDDEVYSTMTLRISHPTPPVLTLAHRSSTRNTATTSTIAIELPGSGPWSWVPMTDWSRSRHL